MNKKQVEELLGIIDEIVREDTIRWTEKRDIIYGIVNGDEGYESSFWEFIAWFETGEEEQKETTGDDE